nr:MAG TPA: hypothetical protein [Caudoviricetes sp.]
MTYIIRYIRMEFPVLDYGGNNNNIYRYPFKKNVSL